MKTKFKKWMDKKGLNIMSFATRHGFSYNTVAKWMSLDRVPRGPYQDKIRLQDPDCPLLDEVDGK